MKCASRAYDYWQDQSGRGVIVLKCQHLPSATTSLWVDGRLRSRHQSRDTWPQKRDKFPQPSASHRSEIRTSGWVHDKVSACASDLLLECSLRIRHVVSPTRDCGKSARKQGRSVPDNFLRQLREVVNVPHHCLATLSVAVHAGQLGIVSSLRIEGLPLPGYHLELTRHV